MPALRSRTDRWKECLEQLRTRDGSVEISVDSGAEAHPEGRTPDVVWRVRLLGVHEAELVVEPPAAFGKTVMLRPGIPVMVGFSIGQNRWMFRSRTVSHRTVRDVAGVDTVGLVLEMPESVERCSRREFHRISTGGLALPPVRCWPLLDPASVAPAEAANRLRIADLFDIAVGRDGLRSAAERADESLVLPEVGPAFPATLLNVSGGGLGLRVDPGAGAAVERFTYFWLLIDLRPEIPAPLAVTARRVHSHLDSAQNLLVGLAFDFAHNPSHRVFITELMTRFVEAIQSRARRASAAGGG